MTSRPFDNLDFFGVEKGGLLEAFALETLALHLTRATNRFGLFTCLTLRRLFEGLAQLHLAEKTLALHLLLKRLKGLVDVVVAYYYLDQGRLHRLDKLKGDKSMGLIAARPGV